MSGIRSVMFQRTYWALAVALVAAAFWVVGILAGIRGWLMTEKPYGIGGSVQEFGEAATVWWVPGSVLTLTAVVMGVGIAVVRHVVDGPVEVKETLPELEPASPSRE